MLALMASPSKAAAKLAAVNRWHPEDKKAIALAQDDLLAAQLEVAVAKALEGGLSKSHRARIAKTLA